MQPQTPRLEIRNLKRSFEGRAVVDDVSLKIMPGQVTCLLGPSGCGKSTTLRMIAGVEMQDSGIIHVDDKLICDTVFRIPPEQREIGLMFQDFALFPHLSVAGNVAYGLRGTKAEKRARVEELWRALICYALSTGIRINSPVGSSSALPWHGLWHQSLGLC